MSDVLNSLLFGLRRVRLTITVSLNAVRKKNQLKPGKIYSPDATLPSYSDLNLKALWSQSLFYTIMCGNHMANNRYVIPNFPFPSSFCDASLERSEQAQYQVKNGVRRAQPGEVSAKTSWLSGEGGSEYVFH